MLDSIILVLYHFIGGFGTCSRQPVLDMFHFVSAS